MLRAETELIEHGSQFHADLVTPFIRNIPWKFQRIICHHAYQTLTNHEVTETHFPALKKSRKKARCRLELLTRTGCKEANPLGGSKRFHRMRA